MTPLEFLKQQISGYENELSRNYKHFRAKKINNVAYAKRKIELKLKIIDCKKELLKNELPVGRPTFIYRKRKI